MRRVLVGYWPTQNLADLDTSVIKRERLVKATKLGLFEVGQSDPTHYFSAQGQLIQCRAARRLERTMTSELSETNVHARFDSGHGKLFYELEY